MAREYNDMTFKMRQIEQSWAPPTEEMRQRCLQLLEAHDALDVAPMLGLES